MNIGSVFGRLTVIRKVEGLGNKMLCRCECGSEKEVRVYHLQRGMVRSCGCLHRDIISKRVRKHGCSRSRTTEYRTWMAMRERCNNPHNKRFASYGGRGITVCDRWSHFVAFLEDMGQRPAGFTLERIDNNKGYEPGNCRWASLKEQANNKRCNVRLSLNGECLTVAQWSERTGIKAGTLEYRIKSGWPTEDILLKPVRSAGK